VGHPDLPDLSYAVDTPIKYTHNNEALPTMLHVDFSLHEAIPTMLHEALSSILPKSIRTTGRITDISTVQGTLR
jgi:hypothetical protein